MLFVCFGAPKAAHDHVFGCVLVWFGVLLSWMLRNPTNAAHGDNVPNNAAHGDNVANNVAHGGNVLAHPCQPAPLPFTKRLANDRQPSITSLTLALEISLVSCAGLVCDGLTVSLSLHLPLIHQSITLELPRRGGKILTQHLKQIFTARAGNAEPLILHFSYACTRNCTTET